MATTRSEIRNGILTNVLNNMPGTTSIPQDVPNSSSGGTDFIGIGSIENAFENQL